MVVFNLNINFLAKYSNLFIFILVNVYLIIRFLIKLAINYIGTNNFISMIITFYITYYLFIIIYEYLFTNVLSDGWNSNSNSI